MTFFLIMNRTYYHRIFTKSTQDAQDGGRPAKLAKLELFCEAMASDFPDFQTFKTFHVVNQRIQGLSRPFRADPLPYMEDLWIEEEE